MEKERELAHLLRFKEVCPFFPEGEVEITEKPDFVVHTQKGLLGIEHTEIFQPGPPHGGSLQAQENLRQRIVSQAKDLYTQTDGTPLRVDVLFHPGVEVKKQDTANIAEMLVHLVGQANPAIGEVVKLKPTWSTWETFPREIAYIQIHRDKRYKDSKWDALKVGFVSSIALEDIQDRIKGKESRLGEYKTRCSEIWLLIVAAEFEVSSTVDLTMSAMEHCYTTEFDRVFFFWNFKPRFIKFKTARDDR